MRYTLRLLTLDQLSRAATLICALELERHKDPDTLGPWPFEIGLWVGRAATPNQMGFKGDNDPHSARSKTIAFQNDDRKPAPIPLENCPWCGEKFKPQSFQLVPNANEPTDLRVVCLNRRCDFTRNQPLPILAVDEPIYRRLPCFLIATVDKFAAMPWTGQVGGFFGRADRYDQHGFYGPCEKDRGARCPAPLQPPDLIIQDELHLISGPMGTMVGLYETALDELCSRVIDGKRVRPKIIASTATVRRAENQIRALFNRREVDIFPPPVPTAATPSSPRPTRPSKSHPRLYLGLAAQGRSLKVVMLRTYLALLGAAQKAYEADGGKKNPDNAADPYMTLARLLQQPARAGRSRRIVEDEVSTRLTGYGNRKRIGQEEGLVRQPDDRLRGRRADLPRAHQPGLRGEAPARAAVPREGPGGRGDRHQHDLGRPRHHPARPDGRARPAEDLRRVHPGDEPRRPRPRTAGPGRHAAQHPPAARPLALSSGSRSSTSRSTAPSRRRASPRSRPGPSTAGLAGTLVALSRLGHAPMTPPKGAAEILHERNALDFVVQTLSDRASSHATLEAAEAEALRQGVRDRAKDLLDAWSQIAHDYHDKGTALQYNPSEVGAAKPLLHDFLDPELKTMNPAAQEVPGEPLDARRRAEREPLAADDGQRRDRAGGRQA